MITILQAYQATIAFFDTMYFRDYSDGLGSLLGDMQLLKNSSDWQKNPSTMDDIMWENWINSVTLVLKRPVQLNDTLTAEQNFTALQHFVYVYITKVPDQNLIIFYQQLRKTTASSPLWKLWIICFQATQNNQLDVVCDSLIGGNTRVDLVNAIYIITHFLQLLLTSLDSTLDESERIAYRAVEQSLPTDLNIKAILANAYKVENFQVTQEVSPLELFKILVRFFTLYKHPFHTDKYEYFITGQPKNYEIYYYWLRAFHEILYSFDN